MADESGAPVVYLRTMEDSRRIKAALTAGTRIGIVGGGWIGLEVASAARNADAEVTLVESLDQPLLRVLGPEVATIFADLHREHGVDLRLGASLTGIARDGDSAVLELRRQRPGHVRPARRRRRHRAGHRARAAPPGSPSTTASAPTRTCAPAPATSTPPATSPTPTTRSWAGPCASSTGTPRSSTARSWPATCSARRRTADALPYFFTDQYDLGMEYVGSPGPDGYDRVVVRGHRDGDRVFTAWWLRDGEVVAGMHVNDWDAIADVRRIVGAAVDADRLADETVPLVTRAKFAVAESPSSAPIMGELIAFPPQERPEDTEAEPLWREAVGQELREERHRQERTLADVAEESGVSTQYLSEVERGRKEPSSEILGAVSGALGLRLVDLTARITRTLAAVPRGPLALRRLSSPGRPAAGRPASRCR